MHLFDHLEAIAAELASKAAPWLTPLLSAIVIAQAMQAAPFYWPDTLAWLTACVIELNGIALISTALLLHNWNRDNAKAIMHRDPKRRAAPANLSLAIVGVAIYFTTTFGLAVVLKVWPGLATAAYGLFVALAGASAVNLALRSGHHRRAQDYASKLDAIAASKSSKKSPKRVQVNRPKMAQLDALARGSATTKAQALDAVLEYVDGHPDASLSKIGRHIGRSKSSAGNYVDELQQAGRLAKNGNGWEISR